MKTIAVICGTGLALASMTALASAQSFNCGDARSTTERSICDSRTLRKLDKEMGLEYAYVRRFQTSPRARKRFIKEQRAWIRQRNRCGANRFCLVRSYRERILELVAETAPAHKRGKLIPTTWNDRGNEAWSNSCRLQGYSIDKDRRGLNVRSGPGKNFGVIARLKRVRDGSSYILPEMEITGSKGPWLHIGYAREGLDGRTLFRGSGWVHSNMVAVTTRGSYPERVILRKSKRSRSRIIARLATETEVRMRSCKGNWAQVAYRGRLGWLAPGDHCGTAVTTCN